MDNNGMFSGTGNTDTGNNTYGYNYGEYAGNAGNMNNYSENVSNSFTQNTVPQNTFGQNTFAQNTFTQNTFTQNTNTDFNNTSTNTYNTTTSSAPNFYATDYNFNSSANGYQDGLEEPMKVSEYLLILALASFVPCVGLIMIVVWALSTTEKQSKVNFCRAYLIIMAIGLALGLMSAVVVASLGL